MDARRFLDVYEEQQQKLFKVLTIKEVCDYYNVARKTVQIACNTMRVLARKADADLGERGGVWLIDSDSAAALWGYKLHKKEAGNNGELVTE